MKAISLRNVIVFVLLINVCTGFALADRQKSLARLSREKGEFEFKDITIIEALEKIGHVVGVEVVLSDEAEWKLPHGEATRLSASLKGSLADCLKEMLSKFFMRYAVSDNKVTIYPRKELEHILGRPSTEQLKLLNKIYSMRISYNGSYTLEQIKVFINEVLADISFLPYDVPKRISDIIERNSTNRGIKGISLAVLLEQVCDSMKCSKWYISGMDFPNQSPLIKLVNDSEYREAVLDQIVDISIKNESEDVILQKITGWTGMELIINKRDSSWLKSQIDVDMQNIKLSQALRNIVSSSDGEMDFDISDNRIEIYGPMRPQKKESAPEKAKSIKSTGGSGQGYVGKISIPIDEGEGKYFIEFMLRERDLTEELKKLREKKIKQILEKFSKIDNDSFKLTFHPQSYTILN